MWQKPLMCRKGGGGFMKIAFYGSSLLSAYWNGAATYYRGLLRALAAYGHAITFYEPDAFDRQLHRDIEPPDWCHVVVYRADATGLRRAIAEVGAADVVIKASGVGVYDDELLDALVAQAAPHALRIFWDVDAPATLAEMAAAADHKLHAVLPKLDLVLTYGGGDPVIASYKSFGAPACFPIYNALDADTHHPVAADQRFNADLTFIGNRLPDREARVDAFFFTAHTARPRSAFCSVGPVGMIMPARAMCSNSAMCQQMRIMPSTAARGRCSISAARVWPRPAFPRRHASSRQPAPAPA